jgi:hypothetical protein
MNNSLYKQIKGDYRLPHNVYMQTLYIIRDYADMKKRREAVLSFPSPKLDGMPRGGKNKDLVAEKAIKLAFIDTKINAVEAAKNHIPPEYVKGVWDKIQYKSRYPDYACYDTWQRWKQRYVYHVARLLDLN